MASSLRSAAVVCCAVLMSACSYTYTNKSNVVHAQRLDDMIVSVEDVRRIAAAEDFAPHIEAHLHKPPPADPAAPEPCRAVGYNDLTFGGGWSDFRSAGYKGVTDDIDPGGNSMVNEVSQAVARYPSSDKAQAAFHKLESSLQACVALHNPNYEFTLDKPDSATLRITDLQWCHLYRAKAAVLVSVGVLGLEASNQIADTILQTITDRIK
ncbi:lipoprotein LpqQ [Mycobacterium numidiamassiliense]|uniref:Lipoprotein LpqQ n=1 Tax=Mycobacterium numidiamassiliense TaxID=1841861 RepID=A0A2U3P3E4_9MYCO|nr:sensor domain-containing protein [Mycobacterium numidiamassiliense]SPM38266.1 lipoprotein LpqQ [Mycobacterium numidiamassiliense]